MIRHKFLAAILISWKLNHLVNAQTLTKFTAAKCLALDPKVIEIDFCFIKAYSRTLTVFNLGLTLAKPAYKPVHFHIIVSYRYGNVFHEVINSKQFEWCSMMSASVFNPIGKLMVLMLSDSIPQLFHPCPYEGKVDLHNISFNDRKWPSVWPSGRYKIDLNISISQTPAIYLFFTTETKSPLNTGSFS